MALLFWLSAGVAAAAPEGLTIQSVEIRGNRKIEVDAIRQKVSAQPGSRLSSDTVRSDIQAIHALGFFDQIEASQEDVSGGVKLVYTVREKPVIAKIRYEGLDAIEESEAKEAVEVKEFEVLDIHKLNTSVQKLTTKYEEKGYYLADVRYDVERDETRNEATVVFKIQENDKIMVKTINIVGNKVLTDDDLKAVMQTKEGGFFSWLTGSGSYREAVFERDIAAMGFYYGTLGYVRARFGKPEVSVSPDKKWVYLTFSVEEGLQYRVGEIDFRGELLYNKTELLEDVQLIQGEVFNAETLRRETLRYTEKYSDLGYAFANVVPQPAIHDDTRTVDIAFEVEKGERVYIGRITVTGNTRTKDKVIRRELTIQEGELFNGTKKRQSRENVVRLGFFDSVEFHQSTSRADPNIIDIEVRVKERSTGQLVIGAGYASGSIGFTAHAQLSQNNFLGNGQVASLSIQILTGQKLYEFNLGFTEPYVGSSLWSLGGDIYQLRRTVSTLAGAATFVEMKTGFDVKLGHPITEAMNLYLTYKAENSYVKHDTIIDRALIPPSSVNGITSSLAASVVYDRRDDRFDPRSGLYWSLSSEIAGLGGDRNFIRNRAEMKFFHPIVWDFIFRSQLKGGSISRTGATPIPINELFIQGGLFSLRGYKNLSLGPTATLSPAGSPNLSGEANNANLGGQQIVIGGQYEVQTNLEIEFPLLKEARIRGVLFFDAGNAFNGSLFDQSPTLFANFGWGFRWFTPIGPLRFEFGYPIVKKAGINVGSPEFYFTIGPPF
jgi:outer membrane protein insertion porin family